MDQFEDAVFIETHYYEGGFKTEFISESSRPEWLPRPEQVGVDNNISLPDDGIAIEISRHKIDSRLVTWVGAYVASNDLVYGARSNYVGIGVWLSDYVIVAAEKLIAALNRTACHIKKNGPTAAQRPGKTLLSDPAYLRSWISPIDDFPGLDSGLAFDASGFPQTTYIDAGIGRVDGAIQRIASSLLCNQLILDNNFSGSSRLLYLAAQEVTASSISKVELKAIAENNPASQILKYFSDSVKKVKQEAKLALNDRNLARTELATEKANHASSLESLRIKSSELSAVQAILDGIKKRLKSISNSHDISALGASISALWTVFDNQTERQTLQKAIERMVGSLQAPTSTSSGSIFLETGQQKELGSITRELTQITKKIEELSAVTRDHRKFIGDEAKSLRSALRHLRDDLGNLRIILYPAGIVFLAILIISSYFLLDSSFSNAVSEHTKAVNPAVKGNNKQQEIEPALSPSSGSSSHKSQQDAGEPSSDTSSAPENGHQQSTNPKRPRKGNPYLFTNP